MMATQDEDSTMTFIDEARRSTQAADTLLPHSSASLKGSTATVKLFRIKLDAIHGDDENGKAEREARRMLVATFGVKLEEDTYYWENFSRGYANAEQVADILAAGIGIAKSELVYSMDEGANTFQRLAEARPSAGTYNTKCDVHLSGNTMTTFNEVMLLENCCTDFLQEQLNAGWRIITVNVQDARRSDYVLGRYMYHATAGDMPGRASRGG